MITLLIFSSLLPFYCSYMHGLKSPVVGRHLMHGRSAFFSLENIELSAGQWSQFLSLTFPTIEESVRNIDELRIGVDAIELRVDLLSNTSPQYLQNGIAQLKEASQLPIMFTVRTKCQLGMFPDDKHKEQIELILEGLKAGVDWIDVEATLPDHAQNEICRIVRTQFANRTRIIGSLHTTTVPTEHELELMYRKCDLNGSADILKVVTGAATDDDCEAVHRIGKRQSKPYIGVCLGEAGAYARVLNRRFTPVTHELLKAAAPGQLTARQLLQERLRRGLITPKQFYLFGNPIQHSLSPAIHNGAFETLLMPHVYSLNEQSDVAAYRDVLTRHNFSGASVTIPHKESIIPLLNEVRGAARAIGAVNTIVVETCSPPDGPEKGVAAPVAAQFSTTTPSVASAASSATAVSKRLIGYNTDWIGMRRPLSQLLLRSERVGSSIAEGKPRCANLTGTGTTATAARVGLVIGAGGTARAACYAIKDLGLELVVASRSPDKAIELAERFGGTAVLMDNLSSCTNGKQLKVVICTLPAAANFTLPDELLTTTAHKPVILDVVYKPASTRLIKQALDMGCLCVQGASMLVEQAVEQFELWHERRAPRDVMMKAVFADVEKVDSTRIT